MQTIVNGYNFIQSDTAVAIGKFDGLHIGHEVILKKLASLKEKGLTTILLTFDPSPDVIFWQGEDTVLLTGGEMEERLSAYGIDYHFILSFTPELSKMSPEDFLLQILKGKLHMKEIVAGEDVSFGYKGRGNAAFLMEKEKAGLLKCHILKKLTVEGIEVSSTRIRNVLSAGDVEQANLLLGYPYSFTGICVEGKHLGRTYGIPTVNFYPEKKKVLPPKGVYFTKGYAEGKEYHAMTNIGLRPSVEEKKGVNLESYFFGDPGELYAKICTIRLCHYFRPEMKFSSVSELADRLKEDRKYCAEYFGINR